MKRERHPRRLLNDCSRWFEKVQIPLASPFANGQPEPSPSGRHDAETFLGLITSCFLTLLATGCSVGMAHNSGLPNSTPGTDTNQLGWSTNAPAVYRLVRVTLPPPTAAQPEAGPAGTGSPAETRQSLPPSGRPPQFLTNSVFDHWLPESLNHTLWTNFIAHTNGRSTLIWTTRQHPANWPTNPPIVAWNTNCLMWGMKGLTALSPCWEIEGGSGQVPVTALTRRHAYTRGHGMGPEGFRTILTGRKVWFLSTNNTLVTATVAREVVRPRAGGADRDYSILLFDHDLPPSIQPLRVTPLTNQIVKFPPRPSAPRPLFLTEQTGNVSAEVSGFTISTWKGGDSGSPNLLPLPGELVFCSGRSTSGPSREMQADMDELCRLQGLDPKRYQLQWVDLSEFPSY